MVYARYSPVYGIDHHALMFSAITMCTTKFEGQFDRRAQHILTRHCHNTTSESRALGYTIIRHQRGCIRCTRETIVGGSSSYAC